MSARHTGLAKRRIIRIAGNGVGMRIYLDNCCLNRPFDNQTYIRIRLETEAKLFVQEKILAHRIELAWSYIIDFVNSANPFRDRLEAVGKWRAYAKIDIGESEEIIALARNIQTKSVKTKDSLHVACAIKSGSSHLLTTDLNFARKLRNLDAIRVLNPVEFIEYHGSEL